MVGASLSQLFCCCILSCEMFHSRIYHLTPDSVPGTLGIHAFDYVYFVFACKVFGGGGGLAVLCTLWNLSSLTRDRTQGPGSESAKFLTTGLQGIPGMLGS